MIKSLTVHYPSGLCELYCTPVIRETTITRKGHHLLSESKLHVSSFETETLPIQCEPHYIMMETWKGVPSSVLSLLVNNQQ